MSINEYRDGLNDEQKEAFDLIGRRDAILRVAGFLGGIAFIGGARVLSAAQRIERLPSLGEGELPTYEDIAPLTAHEVALCDEIADTILPTTAKSPGAKAARTGPFMAVMVRDTYDDREAQIFHEGLKTIDAESRKAYKVGFLAATPKQRLALIERLDREAKDYTDRVAELRRNRKKDDKEADKFLPDQRQENSKTTPDANPAPAITADSPPHYFRMMKELSMLGFFTSEIGMTKAQRYVESPGHFDPCIPYHKGDRAWAGHA